MQLSNRPGKLVLPFAASGNKNGIPVTSQIGITPGAASLADGFPPLTMTPVAAGGVPPSGLDMNGILYEMSAVVRWANAGGGYPYDADFATDSNVTGYPKGARVLRADGSGYWFNTVDGNTTDPDSGAAADWVPDFTTGAAAVTMTSANVTLTPVQYGKPIIVITGLLTANLNLVFPNIDTRWTIVNLTTGGFSLSIKTASDAGIFIESGFVGGIVCYAGVIRTENTNYRYKQASEFGIIGNGSDETSKIQNAIDSAQGSALIFDAGKTYGYTTLTVKANSTLICNGATFARLSASTVPGITIENDVSIDVLRILTPGGASGDKGVLIKGSSVNIDRLSVIATSQGVYNSTNYAVEIESVPAGTTLSDIRISNFYCKYFSTAAFIKNAKLINFKTVEVEYYRTAFYLRDVVDSQFDNTFCRGLGGAVDGRPGENGLLIESSLASDSTRNLTFNKWRVEDSGEHAYRIGGQLSVCDIWFNDCVAVRSGSSILGGNLTGGEWHGGCGFKVLGGNTTTTEFHRNITFSDCGVIDCNITYGSYPAGHGVNNFQPWLIVMAKNVHLNGCWTVKKDQTAVARYGILTTASDGVYLNGCSFRDVDLVPLRPYEETPIVGYPGSDYPLLNFIVNGGLFESITSNVGSGAGLYMQESALYNHKNWTIDGATLVGGSLAVRFETVTTGSYENINFDFVYSDSIVDDATYTVPVIAGGRYSTVSVKAPWRPLAGTPLVKNGSTWQDTLGGQVYTYSNDAWIRGSNTTRITIADDSFATVIPPATLDPGFLLISGSGTTKHMMAWYRASSSPASSKYAGAAATVIVNTALNGTTGTDGNITVGVQADLIYIENRGGSSDSFTITFL